MSCPPPTRPSLPRQAPPQVDGAVQTAMRTIFAAIVFPQGEDPRRPSLRSAFDEGATALVQRPKDLRAGDRRKQLVEIPLTLRLCRLLNLEQVHVVDLTAVSPDRALAEPRVFRRVRFHPRHHGLGIFRLRCRHSFQVVEQARIGARLVHGRHLSAHLFSEPFGEGASSVIEVPVERRCEHQPLRDLQPERVDVGLIDEKGGELLPTLVMPNSDACLTALMVSPPALASPITLAPDPWACRRNEEKSEAGNGVLTEPRILPPFFVTTTLVSRYNACPKA